jgi:heavy metal sensor kinase
MGLNIRTRLTAWYAGLLVLILAVFGTTLYALFSQSLWTHAEESARTRAGQLVSFVESSDQSSEQGTFFDLADPSVVERFSTDAMLIEITDARGRRISQSGELVGHSLAGESANQAALAGRTSLDRMSVPGLGSLLVYTTPIVRRGSIIGVVRVATPLAPLTEALDRLRWLLLAAGTGAVCVAVAGGYLLASLALAPVDRITTTAREIGAGALDRRLRLGGPNDEVRRLARAFDEMLDRIDETLERERRFTADAAHELRTPLTILKGELEVALRRDRAPEQYRQVLASMTQEVDRLVRLTEDLLTLARADVGGIPLAQQPVSLDEGVRWAEEQFRRVAEEKSITLRATGTTPLMVRGDADRLRQLLMNLVDNAIRYTPIGGHVTLTWDRQGHFARLAVSDTGSGIAPEDLPHLFERFYRADRARARAAGGTGLGLAIAKWIAEVHGGRIAVDSRPGYGTTATVWLPLAHAD